ncbi:MAG: hypothetical protein JJ992_05545, partial [Planctomycetes bacterium]|nr:hypothetical protein [Planctomycetota bacterium]
LRGVDSAVGDLLGAERREQEAPVLLVWAPAAWARSEGLALEPPAWASRAREAPVARELEAQVEQRAACRE